MLKSDSWPDCTEDLLSSTGAGSGIWVQGSYGGVSRHLPYGGYNIRIDPVCDQAGYYQVPGNIPYIREAYLPDSDCAQAAGTVGEFIGVESPDPVRFSDLISYDLKEKKSYRIPCTFSTAELIITYMATGNGQIVHRQGTGKRVS